MTLDLAILVALNRVHPRLLPEAAVRGDAGAILGDAVTVTECRLRLAVLEEKGQVVGVSNEDTGRKYHITDAGRVRVAEAGM